MSELRNIIKKLVIYSHGHEITFDQLLSTFEKNIEANESTESIQSLKLARINFEKEYIINSLKAHGWKINETADALGIERTNLFKKMQKLGINKKSE